MESESSYGPIIGLVIIIVIIALGSVYFLQEQEDAEVIETHQETTEVLTEEQVEEEQVETVEAIETQSSEDTLDSIEEDLGATDLDSLEAEFEDLGL